MRKHVFTGFALATLALTACGSTGAPEDATPTEEAPAPVAEAPAESEPAEPSEEPSAASAGVSYMEGPDGTDVVSHKACLDWTKTVDDVELTGIPGLNVAARAIRSDDPAMAELAGETSLGPIITDPWGMTQLCLDHAYEMEPDSLAEEFYIESLMG